ncbi:MAG: hypothetical protein OEW75_00740 [Cyclobacteriaceae bacterium]|nr:hypothetical protein [Cyclobacteriaceae bacterium]
MFFLLSCAGEIEHYNKGESNVQIIDGEYNVSYTADLCHCWKTKDAVEIDISMLAFSAITISIKHEAGNVSIGMIRWSDTDEYDGEYTLDIPVSSSEFSISYGEEKGELVVSGNIDVVSVKMKDGRIVKASGEFRCKLPKETN